MSSKFHFQFQTSSEQSSFRFIRKGKGPAVLLIHGCPGSIEDWLPLGEILSEKFDVIAVDRPGFGESSVKGYSSDFDGSSAFLLHALGELNATPHAVIGHSYGGCVALKLSRSVPSVKGLVLIGAPNYSFEQTKYLSRVNLLALEAGKRLGVWDRSPLLHASPLVRAIIRKNLDKYFSKQFTKNTKEVEERVALWTKPACLERLVRELGSIRKDLRLLADTLESSTLPCLTICGALEDPSFIKQANRFCERRENRRAIIMENLLHYPHVEAPVPVAQEIQAFLGRL